MKKKFKLTEETINVYGITLYRIEAIISFSGVSAGEKGGFVEKEKNVDQSGDAWVYGNARVSGDAWVSGNARVSCHAWVYGNAQVSGDARVYGNVIIKNKGCESTKSYLTIGPIGSDRFITLERSVSIINAGCFSGTVEEFEKAVKEKYGDKSDYYPAIEYIKLVLKEANKPK